MSTTYEVEVGGRTLSFELDRLAFQASGAVLVKYGESTVLVTATMSEQPREGVDFLPIFKNFHSIHNYFFCKLSHTFSPYVTLYVIPIIMVVVFVKLELVSHVSVPASDVCIKLICTVLYET